MEFYKKLKEERLKHNLSQEELALKGVSPTKRGFRTLRNFSYKKLAFSVR
ncbi:hypothetical protein [Bacillus sp. NPDC060175]